MKRLYCGNRNYWGTAGIFFGMVGIMQNYLGVARYGQASCHSAIFRLSKWYSIATLGSGKLVLLSHMFVYLSFSLQFTPYCFCIMRTCFHSSELICEGWGGLGNLFSLPRLFIRHKFVGCLSLV